MKQKYFRVLSGIIALVLLAGCAETEQVPLTDTLVSEEILQDSEQAIPDVENSDETEAGQEQMEDDIPHL